MATTSSGERLDSARYGGSKKGKRDKQGDHSAAWRMEKEEKKTVILNLSLLYDLKVCLVTSQTRVFSRFVFPRARTTVFTGESCSRKRCIYTTPPHIRYSQSNEGTFGVRGRSALYKDGGKQKRHLGVDRIPHPT